MASLLVPSLAVPLSHPCCGNVSSFVQAAQLSVRSFDASFASDDKIDELHLRSPKTGLIFIIQVSNQHLKVESSGGCMLLLHQGTNYRPFTQDYRLLEILPQPKRMPGGEACRTSHDRLTDCWKFTLECTPFQAIIRSAHRECGASRWQRRGPLLPSQPGSAARERQARWFSVLEQSWLQCNLGGQGITKSARYSSPFSYVTQISSEYTPGITRIAQLENCRRSQGHREGNNRWHDGLLLRWCIAVYGTI